MSQCSGGAKTFYVAPGFPFHSVCLRCLAIEWRHFGVRGEWQPSPMKGKPPRSMTPYRISMHRYYSNASSLTVAARGLIWCNDSSFGLVADCLVDKRVDATRWRCDGLSLLLSLCHIYMYKGRELMVWWSGSDDEATNRCVWRERLLRGTRQ